MKIGRCATVLIVSLLVRASSPDPSTTFEDDDECVQKLRYIMAQGRGEGSARCLIAGALNNELGMA